MITDVGDILPMRLSLSQDHLPSLQLTIMGDIKPTTIIAVIPGTRTLGIAVFKELELVYYGIKESSKHRLKHTPHSRAREAVRSIEQVLHKYQPNHFATLSLHSCQQLSNKLPVITEEIARTARHFKLTFHEYQKAEVRNHICPGTRATRQAVAAHLSVLYPELSRYVKGVSLWQRLYYARMFDAVAAGYVRALELQREHERIELARQDAHLRTIKNSIHEPAA